MDEEESMKKILLSRGHDDDEEAAAADNKEGRQQRDEVMMRRRMTITRTWTFVWFPLREKRKMYWYYCHLYDSHRTIHNTLFIAHDMDY